MNVITIDFETYYSKDYSLKGMTTAEYVKDMRFQIIGVAYSVNGSTPKWVSGSSYHIADALRNLPWGNAVCVAQNAIFDGLILEEMLGIKPHRYFCTMMASRPFITPYTNKMSLASTAEHMGIGMKGGEVHKAIGKRRTDFSKEELYAYGNYCKQDVNLTRQVYDRLVGKFPQDELDCIDLTIKKFTRPTLLLDPEVCEERLVEVKKEKEKALALAMVNKEDLMSNAKFAKLLENAGVDVPMKVSPTTGRKTYAFAKTDKEFTKLVSHPNAIIRNLVNARLLLKSTIEETRLERFRTLGGLGPELNVPILYWGARPGRYSGLDRLNLQNLSRGSALRKAIKAAPNHKVVAIDLSQIEARILATLAGQWDLVESFRNGEDVYSNFASDLYRKPINGTDHPRERFVGKTSILQLGYQSWFYKFQDSCRQAGVAMTDMEAKRTVLAYRDRYPKIPELWDTMEDVIHAMLVGTKLKVGPVTTGKNTLWLPNGMPIIYPKLTRGSDGNVFYMVGNMKKDLYGGKMTENVVQALARIVMSTAEVRLARHKLFAALSVHDELIFHILEDYVDKVIKAATLAMTAKVPWMPKLPVACEAGFGDTYYDCK